MIRHNPRRADLHLILAALMLAAALAAGLSDAVNEPKALSPPNLTSEAAVYRPDGGQTLGARGRLRPNELTGLNLGRQIRLEEAVPERLAHLPGLGLKSAEKSRERGCLTTRQRRNLTGLVIEQCDPNNP